MPMTYIPETGTRFWYQKLVSVSGTSCSWKQNFWYQKQTFQMMQMKLVQFVMAVIGVKQRENTNETTM